MTVTLPAVPAVPLLGKPVTLSEFRAPAWTTMFDSVPVILVWVESVAVIDCVPAVLSVAVKV